MCWAVEYRYGVTIFYSLPGRAISTWFKIWVRQAWKWKELAIRVPVNRAAFRNDVPNDVKDEWFRVAGICLEQKSDQTQLWITHHHWDKSESVIKIRVSAIRGTKESFMHSSANENWETLYETDPGLPLIKNPRSGDSFVGVEVGGRIACFDDEHLIFTLGEMGYDGWETDIAVSQDPKSPFGKILLLSKKTGQTQVFSMGHRNPQGLFVSKNRNIWATEHGPRGGDELNLIRQGKNYGWPIVTLGASYHDTRWPLSAVQGSHDGFEWPIYSWSPSIAVSNLIQLDGHAFPVWRGDFLISSLAAGTVFRTRIREGRVIETEPLKIGRRVRDIVEGPNGSIYMWTDNGGLVRMSSLSGNQKQGEMVFARCQVCHTPNLQGYFAIGPDLKGVLGREIASVPGYNYSPAIKRVAGSWSLELLDAYLSDPQSFARGTTMVFPGLEASERRSLLDFLKNY